MKINSQRYWHWLMQLADITEADRPHTRRSFSDKFLEGRAWLTQEMQTLGLKTHIDSAGNLIGRLEGSQPELGVLMTGSHSDSVPSGGRFDGMAGVIAWLELVASWRDRAYTPRHSVEVVDFLAEEPSEWGISCVGSRGITGFLDDALQNTAHPRTGELLKDAVTRMGGDTSQLRKRTDVKAFFEIHIEPGAVLEHENLSVGVVSGIVGILRLNITFKGQAAHAGTTPMHIRRDAMTAAAETAYRVSALANQHASQAAQTAHYFTATCGQIFGRPNASNVVPGQVQIVFDIRSDDKSRMEQFATELHDLAKQAAVAARVELVEFERMTDTFPMFCDEALMQHIGDAALSQNISHRVMPSGAGHDAAFLSHISPAAMVFVPSKDGKSHCPEEYTSPEQFALGMSVLVDAMERFDSAQN